MAIWRHSARLLTLAWCGGSRLPVASRSGLMSPAGAPAASVKPVGHLPIKGALDYLPRTCFPPVAGCGASPVAERRTRPRLAGCGVSVFLRLEPVPRALVAVLATVLLVHVRPGDAGENDQILPEIAAMGYRLCAEVGRKSMRDGL